MVSPANSCWPTRPSSIRLKEYFSIRCAVGLLPLTSRPHSRAGLLQLGVRHRPVDGAHPDAVLGGVLLAEEEDLAGELLADLAGEVRRPEAAVEAAHVGVGLLEPAVLGAGEGQVADHVQGVPTAGRPAVDHADHDLGHEPDQPLALQDVQPAELGLVDVSRQARPPRRAGLVQVARPAADPLVAAGAEGPLAVLLARAVAGEQDAADVARRARVLEDAQQLVDRVRPERVEHVGAVERDPHRAVRPGPVVGEVGQVLEPGDVVPVGRVEDLADSVDRAHDVGNDEAKRARRCRTTSSAGSLPRGWCCRPHDTPR